MAAESRLREKELSRQHEINKRLAPSSDTTLSNSSNPGAGVVPSVMKEKPLIEQTRRAILEAQSGRLNNFGTNPVPCDQKRVVNDSSGESHVSAGVSMKCLTANTRSIECNC
jgi:sodium channel modifier 1